ncbi:UDP-N-acetylmuramate dehydrogenase [Mycolicibacterium fallax]|uniref:UDP-N-acetylenolpyruvoylglucosamine reductase n=1 Tax=Mycolicibacterium fallax TaxID=1793 RepID=A0A1X1QZD3_MYCFA|nr:UDP-N-acetylmuramate dehydrogenase [Mycolicibacterium fallax]ORU96758.1 UDP-N-acetylenolpyruvoylglucosamine reductase [Mycolicibacterium fallax]BBY97886.1 UDP-N-acetylenolpyruvoylglucosamine reductase [Mycolicibacterium fallax]
MSPANFAALTTLRVGGPVARLMTATTAEELVTAAADPDALLVGGGSNLLVGDDGFPGTVVLVRTTGVEVDGDLVTVAAGENWDGFVAEMLAAGRGQLSALSGIPGTVGATPIQNVGAYGADVSQFLTGVTVYDRELQKVRDMSAEDCGFGYRTSIFKRNSRRVVLSVTFRLPVCETASVTYPQLAGRLGVRVGDDAPAGAVRDAVLALRRSKGMVLDAEDRDTWSVGSFFINPVVAEVPAAADGGPAHPAPAGVKLSAAWLIENAGFGPGFTVPGSGGRAALSTKHTLAITNRGGATAADVLELAGHIRDGVWERFGVQLAPEATLVGCELR